MALAPKLELRQGQQLVMTPQLQQAIRLLQLSNVELCTFVETEVERNPAAGARRGRARAEPRGRSRRARRARTEGDNDWVGRRRAVAAQRRRPATEGEANGAPPGQRRRARGRRLGFAAAAHQQRLRRRGHQPRGLRRRRPVAGGLPDRAAARCRHRSRRAADRRPSHPYGRRGRLPARRPRRPRRQARRAGRR